MAGVTAASSVITDALRTQALAGVVDTTWRNNEVLQLFPIRPLTGGATLNRKMLYGSNSSVSRYNEGDSVGVAGAQSYLTAQWPVSYYRCKVQFTGHAKDQLKNGAPSAAFFNQLELEFTKGVADLVDLVSNDFLGTGTSAPVGIQGIISGSGTVAGVNRSTFTWFAAYETSNGTTVSLADLDLAERNSRDSDNASDFNEYWTSYKQLQKYKGVVGNAGQANNSIMLVNPTNGLQLPGASVGDYRIGGRMVRPIRDLTNSIWLGVTTDLLFTGLQRDMQTVPLAIVDDSESYLITMALGAGTDNPRKHWKLTGYSA